MQEEVINTKSNLNYSFFKDNQLQLNQSKLQQ